MQYPAVSSYAARLRDDLSSFASEFERLLDASRIVSVNFNTSGSSVTVLGAADYDWAASDDATSVLQMRLLGRYEGWFERFTLLFPHPTPAVESRIKQLDDFARRWLRRDDVWDYSIPPSIEAAKQIARDHLDGFYELLDLAEEGSEMGLRVIPDTNALLRNPAVETYADALGETKYLVHLVTTVLRELDELKDRGRTEDVREKARSAVRRIKGLRERGSLADGVTVSGQVQLKVEHREVPARSVLTWLDPSVPDDRIVAAALRLQSDHPSSVVVLVTADLNLQNKADAVGLPFIEPPENNRKAG